jgi:hypothetical protein
MFSVLESQADSYDLYPGFISCILFLFWINGNGITPKLDGPSVLRRAVLCKYHLNFVRWVQACRHMQGLGWSRSETSFYSAFSTSRRHNASTTLEHKCNLEQQ